MTPEQTLEAAKLIRQRGPLIEKLAEIDGRLKKLGVEIPAGK